MNEPAAVKAITAIMLNDNLSPDVQRELVKAVLEFPCVADLVLEREALIQRVAGG